MTGSIKDVGDLITHLSRGLILIFSTGNQVIKETN